MITATVDIKGLTPYQQGRMYADEVPKKGKETHADYEKRTWRHRAHKNKDGFVVIPPMCFKKALEASCKHRGDKGPKGGKTTWTKYFERGIMLTEPAVLGVKWEDVDGVLVYVPSDGKPGGGSRVPKWFPTIHPPNWDCTVTYYILDEIITREAFEDHLKTSGSFIGIGVFRPENRGFHGRFIPTLREWNASE